MQNLTDLAGAPLPPEETAFGAHPSHPDLLGDARVTATLRRVLSAEEAGGAEMRPAGPAGDALHEPGFDVDELEEFTAALGDPADFFQKRAMKTPASRARS